MKSMLQKTLKLVLYTEKKKYTIMRTQETINANTSINKLKLLPESHMELVQLIIKFCEKLSRKGRI